MLRIRLFPIGVPAYFSGEPSSSGWKKKHPYGCWTKNRGGKPPKMDGENNGKPYFLMGWFLGVLEIFPIWIANPLNVGLIKFWLPNSYPSCLQNLCKMSHWHIQGQNYQHVLPLLYPLSINSHLIVAQPPPCCSFARHLVGKMVIHCSFAHH